MTLIQIEQLLLPNTIVHQLRSTFIIYFTLLKPQKVPLSDNDSWQLANIDSKELLYAQQGHQR